jgi:hypothetical protein
VARDDVVAEPELDVVEERIVRVPRARLVDAGLALAAGQH